MCPQQMLPSLRSPRNIMGNNVSATMCPRLPGPLLACGEEASLANLALIIKPITQNATRK